MGYTPIALKSYGFYEVVSQAYVKDTSFKELATKWIIHTGITLKYYSKAIDENP